jgi:hypothetical protein
MVIDDTLAWLLTTVVLFKKNILIQLCFHVYDLGLPLLTSYA